MTAAANPGWFDGIVLAAILIGPIFEWLWSWPHFVRAIHARLPGARARFYRNTIIVEWVVTLYILGLWIATGRPFSAIRLGLSSPVRLGVGFLVAGVTISLLALQSRKIGRALTRPEVVARLRAKLVSAGPLIPETNGERRSFWFVSITAGICEEVVFRGFLLWFFTAWLGLIGAVIVSSIVFGYAHIYLGLAQVPRTAVVGLVLALIVVATGSLWPAMVIHAAVDMNSGEIGFRVGRAAQVLAD